MATGKLKVDGISGHLISSRLLVMAPKNGDASGRPYAGMLRMQSLCHFLTARVRHWLCESRENPSESNTTASRDCVPINPVSPTLLLTVKGLEMRERGGAAAVITGNFEGTLREMSLGDYEKPGGHVWLLLIPFS